MKKQRAVHPVTNLQWSNAVPVAFNKWRAAQRAYNRTGALGDAERVLTWKEATVMCAIKASGMSDRAAILAAGLKAEHMEELRQWVSDVFP